MVVRLAAFVLLAALASVEAARGSLKLRKDDQVAAISLTTKSCMSVHDECVSRKAALCREFGVPMYHSDCMQAIQDKCWSFLQHNATGNSKHFTNVTDATTGPLTAACDDCADSYTTAKQLCTRKCREYERLQSAVPPGCHGDYR
eukprot:gnl/TRDRNA2_/TRDRNA2_85540_c0_seq2.p1 gnl/TRDRNA2_/TRDRNA2_85540_c0~~gnl/TRDRNA2_/TRDRNA2_85540_c0_seq2.p1  ORF type:complete len:145 (+),score=30.53 gnl/TRDRNA2_/TRDRNA2_85540_c0_seq2:132-566(+)